MKEFASLVADPPDVNVLKGDLNLIIWGCKNRSFLTIYLRPEYRDDPRVVSNLFDGLNRTCDPRHMWLAPFCRGTDHTITVTFKSNVTLAMVRNFDDLFLMKIVGFNAIFSFRFASGITMLRGFTALEEQKILSLH